MSWFKDSAWASIGFAYSATEASRPIVATNVASSITSNSAVGGGYSCSTGGADISASGVHHGIAAHPTTGTAIGSGTGAFSGSISSLSAGTLYYYRAYATNSVGTAYGAEYSFTTLAA